VGIEQFFAIRLGFVLFRSFPIGRVDGVVGCGRWRFRSILLKFV